MRGHNSYSNNGRHYSAEREENGQKCEQVALSLGQILDKKCSIRWYTPLVRGLISGTSLYMQTYPDRRAE